MQKRTCFSPTSVILRLGIAWSIFLAFSFVTAKERPPNIVLILADDLGYGDLSCFGQKTLKTPRLDMMASEGMKLTQFYAGCTVCAPSRSVLLTGRHMGAHGRTRQLHTTDCDQARSAHFGISPEKGRLRYCLCGQVGSRNAGQFHEPQ